MGTAGRTSSPGSCRAAPADPVWTGVGGAGETGVVPELPEVHALVADLGTRLGGRTVERFDLVSFAALKTFDPPVSALAGGTVR